MNEIEQMKAAEFEALARQIEQGEDIDHDTLIDLLMRGLVRYGQPVQRDQVARMVHTMYPTREDVVAYLREMLAGYVSAFVDDPDATRQ